MYSRGAFCVTNSHQACCYKCSNSLIKQGVAVHEMVSFSLYRNFVEEVVFLVKNSYFCYINRCGDVGET